MADDPMPKELIRDPKTGKLRPPRPGEDTEPAAPKSSAAQQTVNGVVKALGGGDSIKARADKRYGGSTQ